MEKTLYIDGKQLRLKSTGGTAKRYKSQFGKDYFAELLKLAKSANTGKDKTIDLSKLSFENLEHMDFEVVYDFVWVLAKTADPSIPDPQTFLDSYDSFPMMEILPEITDLLTGSIQSKKK